LRAERHAGTEAGTVGKFSAEAIRSEFRVPLRPVGFVTVAGERAGVVAWLPVERWRSQWTTFDAAASNTGSTVS
jgi:hypothetical protein